MTSIRQMILGLALLVGAACPGYANPTNLTDDASATYQYPAWSPDGQHIAMATDRGGGGRRIFLFSPVDRSYTMVSEVAPVSQVTWSPDGRQLAFSARDSRGRSIWVINVDGSGARSITGGRTDEYPAWSPRGDRIAFVSNGPEDDGVVYLVDPDGNNQERLTLTNERSWHPTWSPDGSMVAFSGRREGRPTTDIVAISVEDQTETFLTHHPAHDQTPSWSPDGTRIAFRSERDSEHGEIYLMDLDGSGLRRLTHNHDDSEWFPTWSPDGNQIAYQAGSEFTGDIYLVWLDRPLTPVLRLSWGEMKISIAPWAPMRR